jgi:hypothetical protein
MSKQALDNLVAIRKLRVEPALRAEFEGMIRSARKRLADAQNEELEADSQFDLAYGAAHRLALAALRQHGYRSEDRISADLQIFLRAQNERNLAEYEGRTEIDEQLLADVIRCTKKLDAAVGKLKPPT